MKKIFLLPLLLFSILGFSQRELITDPDGNPIEITPIDPVDPTPVIPATGVYHDTQGKFIEPIGNRIIINSKDLNHAVTAITNPNVIRYSLQMFINHKYLI